jgi:hypothetical protein
MYIDISGRWLQSSHHVMMSRMLHYHYVLQVKYRGSLPAKGCKISHLFVCSETIGIPYLALLVTGRRAANAFTLPVVAFSCCFGVELLGKVFQQVPHFMEVAGFAF